MKPIITVEGLGKKYRIMKGVKGSRANPEPPSLFKRGPRLEMEDFWALKDVNFEIKPGERVGIIGRNGAGKSTLLKLLSRITEPTTGRITLHGRVASLLEVGTGFHPELTGRENIFLNGAVLGMRKSEILRKFDEIIDFAGVEEFLDVPVKRYSSGMYVRLGFAIAAHLEPEILVVDEVLAVGDAEFQKKCLGKMEEVSTGQGRTVLFVSHNSAMITALCPRALLLESGSKIADGPTQEVFLRYFGAGEGKCKVRFSGKRALADSKASLLAAWMEKEDGTPSWEFDISEPVRLGMEYEIFEDTHGPAVPNLHFVDQTNTYAFVVNMPGVSHGKPGRYTAQCTIPADLLNVGILSISFALTSYAPNEVLVHFFEQNALQIGMTEDVFNNPARYSYGGPIPGTFRPQCCWTQEMC